MLMKKIRVFFTVMVLMATSLVAFAQDITVKGTVKDASGEPLVGANVVLQGSNTVYTMTDLDGAFTLKVPSDGNLEVQLLGYKKQVVAVAGNKNLTIVLEDDSQVLDETIVVAFGTTTREAFTGSAKVVGEEKLSKSQVASVTNALAGAVAGVQLTSSNGAPGSSSTIRIRGYSSINAGLDPLIIVDGAPYSGDISNINANDIETMTVLKDAASNALYGARGANGVIMITTKRAKAGEALITFDAKVGVNTKALKNYDVITDPAMYYETHYKALVNYYTNERKMSASEAWASANANIGSEQGNGGLGYIVYTVPEGQAFIGKNGKINPNATLGRVVGDYYMTPDKWEDYGYRKGIRKEYNFSAAKSYEMGSFYSSLSYLNEEGITKGSDLERLTGRLRADYQVKPWFKLASNVSFTHAVTNTLSNNGSSTSTGNIWAFTSNIAPIYPLWVRNADGTIYKDSNGIDVMDYGNGIIERGGFPGYSRPFLSDANALQQVLLNTDESVWNASTGNMEADINLLPNLTLIINGTYQLDETRFTEVLNPYYGQFRSTGGTVYKSHSRTFNTNFQQLLRYNPTIGNNHITITLGHEYTDNTYAVLSASKSKMFSQKNKELNGAIQDGQSSGSYFSEYNNEGYFANAQYDLASKLFLSGSFRKDASSRFGPEYRWGNFWSTGAAYIISKESWFNTDAIKELKLKASIGSQGNDNIGSYRYIDTFDITNSSGSLGTSFRSKGTKDITWETNTNFNAGVEFNLFNRLTGSVEYFKRTTTDMLFSFSVAPSLGYSAYWDNVGDLYNKGWEIDLSLNLIDTKAVRWDVNFNVTTIKNQITKLHQDKKTTDIWDLNGNYYQGYASNGAFLAEGLPMYTWREKEFAGVDPETGKSLWYMNVYVKDPDKKDADGNPVDKKETDEFGNEHKTFESTTTTDDWSKADYYVTNKTAIPDFYGGIGTSLYVGGFDFAINTSYQFGGYQYDATYASFMGTPLTTNTGQNFHVDVLNAWTADKPSETIPRWQFGDTYSAGGSSRFLTKATYFNIENITFGYTLPAKITTKLGIQSLRIYATAQNLNYWSMRKGFDPRQGSGNTDTNATYYSPMKTVSGGVTIKF